MAERARLIPTPQTPREQWPYHKLKARAVPVALAVTGDRRLDGEAYLTSGFGIRRAIEAKATGYDRLSNYLSLIHISRSRLPSLCSPLSLLLSLSNTSCHML